MAVRIDGNNDLINAADGSLTIEGISVNVVGVSTATGGFKVGTAYTVFPNGNVATAGVVTTTKLQVNSATNTAAEFRGGGGAGFISIKDGDDGTQAFIGVDAGKLKFQTSGSSYSDKVVIATDGKVGIGSEIPTAALNVSDSSPVCVLNREVDSVNQLNFKTLGVQRGSIGASSGSCLQVHDTSSIEKFRILQNGKVGVGTDNPSGTLTLFGVSSSSLRISKSGVLAYDHTFDGSSYTIANNNGSAGIPIIIGTKTAGGESLRIDSGGDVRVTSRGSSASGAPFYVAVTGKSSITYGGGNDDTACLRIVDNGSTNSYYHGIELRAKRDGDARIYVQDKGSDAVDLVFATDNSGIVEGMRLDSSQRLLIGTDSAVGGLAHHLQVVEPDGGKLCLARNDTTVSNGANLGEIAAYGNDNNGNYQESSKIEFQAGLNHGDNDKPGRLVFSVTADGGSSATERLRITHDGKLDMFAGGASSFRIDPASTSGKAIFTADADSNFGSSGYDFRIDGTDSNALMMVIRRGTNPFVGIGRDSQQSAERLSVDRAGQVAFFTMSMNANHSNLQMLSQYATSSTSGTQISFLDNTGTQRGRITNDNSTTTYHTSSDYRLKENEVLISDGITRLKTLKPYRFSWKQKPGVTVDGFFAHEVTSAVPEAIDGEKDAVVTQAMVDAGTHDSSKLGDPEYQMIDQSKLVPLLTAALQEEISKREALEARVAALEGS